MGKAHGYGDVHLVKTHYKDLRDGIWKDCWNIVWDNDEGRIAFMDECAANFFSEDIVKVVVNEPKWVGEGPCESRANTHTENV